MINNILSASDYIKDLNLNFEQWLYVVIIPLIIVFAISGLIGLERQNVGKAAGFSAHVLVGLASAGIAIMQQFMYQDQLVTGVTGPEGQRVIAQVVSGVGFIGAGVILKDHKTGVRGITTAATIWAIAGVGLIIGSGYVLVGSLLGLVMVAFIYVRDLTRGINPFMHISEDHHLPQPREPKR